MMKTMNETLIIHLDHFDDLALDIAGDLLNRGLISGDNEKFFEANRIIIWRLKHQQFINNNPEDYIDSPSKAPMSKQIKE